MPSISVENYLKAMYHLERRDGERVKTKVLAEELDISLPSVTAMLKSLSDAGSVEYVPYRGARLTVSGRAEALRVIRNHRLIEMFLVETLGYTWDEVHDEAERLEHAMSDRLADRIDSFLGYPETDPHGDPIPDRAGNMPLRRGEPLMRLEPGTAFRVLRVTEQDATLLRFLDESSLRPGSQGLLIDVQPFDGTLILRTDAGERALSRAVAEFLLVEEV